MLCGSSLLHVHVETLGRSFESAAEKIKQEQLDLSTLGDSERKESVLLS